MNNDLCEEVLENIKYSLLHCKNNNYTYELKTPLNISKCDNISRFQSGLHATETKILMNIPRTVEKYSIKYNVRERTLELE
jgi:hypothetical protein